MSPMRPPPSAGGRAPAGRPYVARLAMLRAQGAVLAGEPAQRVGGWLASALLYLGAAVAGAVWIGGSLFDLRAAGERLLDQAAVGAGFKAHVAIVGAQGERLEEAQRAALPSDRFSMVAAEPQAVRNRLRQLPWVEDAFVQRHWPSRLTIELRRKPSDLATSARGGA